MLPEPREETGDLSAVLTGTASHRTGERVASQRSDGLEVFSSHEPHLQCLHRIPEKTREGLQNAELSTSLGITLVTDLFILK